MQTETVVESVLEVRLLDGGLVEVKLTVPLRVPRSLTLGPMQQSEGSRPLSGAVKAGPFLRTLLE